MKNWNLYVRYQSIKTLMAWTPLIFMQSAICCLRHTYSINQVCNESNIDLIDDDLKRFCSENGPTLNSDQVFRHNFWNWTLFFFLGVNFTHFDYLPEMNHFTFSAEDIPKWPLWFFFLTGTFACGLIALVTNLVFL